LTGSIFINKKIPHSSLNGKTPYEKYLDLESHIPIQPEVTAITGKRRLKLFQETASGTIENEPKFVSHLLKYHSLFNKTHHIHHHLVR
jgi:hypothetical protein